MIVVVGLPAYQEAGDEGGVGGLAADVAIAARQAGARVELAGKIGDDAAGDAVVLALGRLGIGHAALQRDPARPTPLLVEAGADGEAGEAGEATAGDAATAGEAATAGQADAPQLLPVDAAERPALEAGDVALGLKYLAGATVVVLAEPLPVEAAAAGVESAAFSGAQLVVVVSAGAGLPELPAGATVLEAPAADDGSFGRLVGAFAAGLDRGAAPADAFGEAVRSSGWEQASAEETAS